MNERTARFLDGIASVETSGYSREDSYYAEGVLNDNGERAYGRYQFLPSTYREFSEKAGLLNEDGSLDWSPDTQDAVAAYWAEDLLSRYDANHAARAWLGGEGNVYNDGAADANGMTVADYGARVAAFMGEEQSPLTALGSVPADTMFHNRYGHAYIPDAPEPYKERDPISRFVDAADDALLDSGVTSSLRYLWSWINPEVRGTISIPGFSDHYTPTDADIDYVKKLMPYDATAQSYVLGNAYSQQHLYMLAAMKKQDYDRAIRLANDSKMEGWNVAGFVGGVAGSMLDPAMLATMAVPAGAASAAFGKVIARLGTNAMKLSQFSKLKAAKMAARAATGAGLMLPDRYLAHNYGGFEANYLGYMAQAAVLGNAFDIMRMTKHLIPKSDTLKQIYSHLSKSEDNLIQTTMGLQPIETVKRKVRTDLKGLNDTEVDFTVKKTGKEASANKAKKDDLKLTGKLTEDNMPEQPTKQVKKTAQAELQKRLKMKDEEMEALGLRTPTEKDIKKRKLNPEDVKKQEEARNRWVVSSEQAKNFAMQHGIKLTKRMTAFTVPGTGQFVVIGDRIKTKNQLKKVVSDGYTKSRGLVDDVLGKKWTDWFLSEESFNPKGITNFVDYLDDIGFWDKKQFVKESPAFFVMVEAKKHIKELRGQNRKVSNESVQKWMKWAADEQRYRDQKIHVDPDGTAYICDTELARDNPANPFTEDAWVSDMDKVESKTQKNLHLIPKRVGRYLESEGIFQTIYGVLANSRLGLVRTMDDLLFTPTRGRAGESNITVCAEKNKAYLQQRLKPYMNDYYDARNEWLKSKGFFKFLGTYFREFDRQVQMCYNATYAGNTRGLKNWEMNWDKDVAKAAETVHTIRQKALGIMQERSEMHGGIKGQKSFLDAEWKPLDDEFHRKVDHELLTRMLQFMGTDSNRLKQQLEKYAHMAVKRDVVRKQMEDEAQRTFKKEHAEWEEKMFGGKDTRNPKGKGKQKVLPVAYDTAKGHTATGYAGKANGKMPEEFTDYETVKSSKMPKKNFTEAPEEPELQKITDDMVDEYIETRCKEWAEGIVEQRSSMTTFGDGSKYGVSIPDFMKRRLPMDTTVCMPLKGANGTVIDFSFDKNLRDFDTDRMINSYIDRVCGEVATYDSIGNWRTNNTIRDIEESLHHSVQNGEITKAEADKQLKALEEGMSRLLSTHIDTEPKTLLDAFSNLFRTKSYEAVGGQMWLAQLGEFGSAVGYAGTRVLLDFIPVVKNVRRAMLSGEELNREDIAKFIEQQAYGKSTEPRFWDRSSSYDFRSFKDARGYTDKFAQFMDGWGRYEKIFSNITSTLNQLPKLTDAMIKQTRVSGIIDSIKWAKGEKFSEWHQPFSDQMLRAAHVTNVKKLHADILKYIGKDKVDPDAMLKWQKESTDTYFQWRNLVDNYSNRSIQQMSIGNTPLVKERNWFTRMLFQFKDYTLRAVNDQTLRALSTWQKDDFLAATYSMGTNLLSYMGLVYLRAFAKYPNDPEGRQAYVDKNLTMGRLAWAAVSRGAITGSLPSFASDIYEITTGTPMMRTTVNNSYKQGDNNASGIMGRVIDQMPAFSSGLDPIFGAVGGAYNMATDGLTREDVANVMRVLPFNGFAGLTLAASETSDLLGAKPKKQVKAEKRKEQKKQKQQPQQSSSSGLSGIMNVK